MRGPEAGAATSSGQRSALKHRLVVAVPARDEERPHPELAHVADGHRLDRLVEAGHAALPRSTNSRYNPMAAQPCVALCTERRQVFCPDEAAGFAVRRFAGAQSNHIRSARRGDRQHNSERKQGRQNAASSLSHINPLDLRIFAGSSENAAFYQRRRTPARTRGLTLFEAGPPEGRRLFWSLVSAAASPHSRSSASKTARPSGVSTSRAAASRSTRPHTTIALRSDCTLRNEPAAA
jgi:hypothetical protein